MTTSRTHYRKAFKSPYLSSADVVEPVVLTVARVALEPDKTGKSKEYFNTAYFVEEEIRPGEPLKPMILNATNSRTMANRTGHPFIEEWVNVRVTIFVDRNVRLGGNTVEGLRISQVAPTKNVLTPEHEKGWENAKKAFLRDGNLDKVLARVDISPQHQAQLKEEAHAVA